MRAPTGAEGGVMSGPYLEVTLAALSPLCHARRQAGSRGLGSGSWGALRWVSAWQRRFVLANDPKRLKRPNLPRECVANVELTPEIRWTSTFYSRSTLRASSAMQENPISSYQPVTFHHESHPEKAPLPTSDRQTIHSGHSAPVVGIWWVCRCTGCARPSGGQGANRGGDPRLGAGKVEGGREHRFHLDRLFQWKGAL